MSERRITRGSITDRKDIDLHATVWMKRIVEHDYDKLTSRNQFAMAALTGMISNGGYAQDPRRCVENSYEYADAMLEERKK